jgi:modulator of FtsH protease HflC
MQNKITPLHILLSLLSLTIFFSSIYTLDQRKTAIVFQFGEAVREVTSPGLYIKVPFIQNVEYFDKRVLHIDAEAKELTASDGKRIIVDAFAKFTIQEPVKYYKTVQDFYGASIRLNKILESQMRKVIGRIELTKILSSDRRKIMQEVLRNIKEEAEQFGINVIDVRILRADLPKENSAAIYTRMQTEREKEARMIRAEGREEAARIISRADKESKIILAEAYKDSEIIKGEGDAESAKIFNDAFGKDEEFYSFVKHLQTYKETFSKEGSTFVISPNSKFLKHLRVNE